MISAFLKLLNSIGAFILEKIRHGVDWLRQPTHTLKVICALFAALTLFLGFVAYEKEQTIKNLRVVIVERENQCRIDIASRNEKLTMIADILQEEVMALERMREQNAAILSNFAEQQEKIETGRLEWKHRYESQDDICKSALQLLDSACPALEGY